MATLIAYLVIALAVWAHPTNSVGSTTEIVVEFGNPPAGHPAAAWPARDGLCHIQVRQEAWEIAPPVVREFMMTHEVGHCLGIWGEAPDWDGHKGNGIMGCGYIFDAFETCQFTAHDQFAVDALNPSLIVRRAFMPMVSN
jgi:hypothetical protein